MKAPRVLPVGDPAPAFELESDAGDTVRLDALRGRWIVLYFYPKDDTSSCTKEACGFRDRLPSFDRRDVAVLGVSPDDVASHRKFREKYDLNFPLLSDPDHAVAEVYGAWGRKKLYGREYEGILRTTFIIDPGGRIARVYQKVRPAEHAAELLAELEDLERA